MSNDAVVLAYGLSALACLLAVMWQSECDPQQLAASDQARFRVRADKMMEAVTTPDMIATWFQWIKDVRQVNGRPLTASKKYFGQYSLGPFGPYPILLNITEYERGRLLGVEADSRLRPHLRIEVVDLGKGCDVKVSMVFNRTSALFQYTVGWVARHLTQNQFRHSLFMLRMMMRPDPDS